METQVDVVTITERTIMEGTPKDPKFMESVNIAAAQASADNVDWLMEDADHNKEKMLKLKANLVKTNEEGIELKRKYDAILFEKESVKNEYPIIEMEKDALDV